MPLIYTLPNELLLEIGSHIHGRHRNTDLASLCLVSQRLRPVGQEHLLREPTFHLDQIHNFLWELGHRSWVIPKIRRLEIKSTRKSRVDAADERDASRYIRYPALACPPQIAQSTEFLHRCNALIAFYARHPKHQAQWQTALHTDVVAALLGIALVVLPNLQQLHLAATWLMDFPVFAPLLAANVTARPSMDWKHDFLAGALAALRDNLRVLHVPTDLRGMQFAPRCRALFDFRAFTRLRELSLPMDALSYGLYHRVRPPAEPRAILPQSLEVLRISEATETTANFVNNLCLAKKRASFPGLRRVEVIYCTHRGRILTRAYTMRCPHPVRDVVSMCTDAGLGVWLYFPGSLMCTADAGASLWGLRDAGLLREVEEEVWAKRMGVFGVPEPRWEVFELGIDADGDVEME